MTANHDCADQTASSDEGRRRVLLYSHDSFGLGHLRRSITIAAAIAEADPDVSILCLTGSPTANLFKLPPRCDLVKIPCITKDQKGSYISRYLPASLKQVVDLRSELISATIRSFCPHVLLVDHTPAGPGDELVSALRRARKDSPHTRVVLGLRDIIDAPDRAKAQLRGSGILDVIRRDYEQIIIYGHPKVLDICVAYDMPDEIRARSKYVGFVSPRIHRRSRNDHDDSKVKILVTAGGGEDGYDLLSAVVSAQRGPHQGLNAETTFVAGPLMRKEEVEALRVSTRGDSRLHVVDTTRHMRRLLADADLVISMGGYNSIYEALSQNCRLLVLPRRQPRLEQLERSQRLQKLGLLATLGRASLEDPTTMAKAIDAALARPKPDSRALGLAFDGAQVTAKRVLALCHATRRSPKSDPVSRT